MSDIEPTQTTDVYRPAVQSDRERAEAEFHAADEALAAALADRNRLAAEVAENNAHVIALRSVRTTKRKILFALMTSAERRAAREHDGEA